MATVNKNFRIKNGLVVEGSTATVNGQNILTETGSDTYILNLIGGETLVKSVSSDFTVTGGGELQINSSSDLARTGDIPTETSDLTEANGVLYFTDQRAKDAAGDLLANASKTNIQISYTPGATGGLTITAENGVADSDTDDLTEGATNLYFTNQRALDATSSAYDAAGTADTAISNALGGGGSISDAISTAINGLDTDDIEEGSTNLYYTDSRVTNVITSDLSIVTGNIPTAIDNAINAIDTDDIEEGATNLYFTDSRARGAISDGTGIDYDSSTGVISVDSTIATKTYVDDAIDNLVDGAPNLLNTLNEIAAAINDDANYFTTIATQIAGKQDTLTAGSNIDITSNTISVTGLTTDDVSEGSNKYATAENIIDELTGYGTIDLGSVDIDINGAVSAGELNSNILRSEDGSMNRYTVSNSIATAGTATTGAQFAASVGTSVKYLIKLNTSSHSHVWEALATVDGSNNIAVTEYAEVTTNGSLGSAAYSLDSDGKGGYTLNLAITSTYNNTSYKVIAEQF